jgi:hypothetical protein
MNKDLAYLVSNIDLQRKFKSTPDQIMIKLYPELNDIEDIMDILPSDSRLVKSQVIGLVCVAMAVVFITSIHTVWLPMVN